MCSSGFCLLNNVCIGAAYAKNTYGKHSYGRRSLDCPVIRRIAIVDFDIHHGNGSEDIIRNLIPREVNIPLPGSWAEMKKKVYKPWLDENDANETLFSSIHLYNGETFYPCSGNTSVVEPYTIINIPMDVFNIIYRLLDH